jgi:hypothetical protein
MKDSQATNLKRAARPLSLTETIMLTALGISRLFFIPYSLSVLFLLQAGRYLHSPSLLPIHSGLYMAIAEYLKPWAEANDG